MQQPLHIHLLHQLHHLHQLHQLPTQPSTSPHYAPRPIPNKDLSPAAGFQPGAKSSNANNQWFSQASKNSGYKKLKVQVRSKP
jgi:hypothetical protein